MSAAPSRPHHASTLDQLEVEVYATRRVGGALRAVQHLACPERFSEGELVSHVRRDDLAQLLEVLQCDLHRQLSTMEGLVEELQGYMRNPVPTAGQVQGRPKH